MLNKKHYPLIRTIYLYLFALIGLALLIIGGVLFVSMGLRVFIFTAADEQERMWHQQPPAPFMPIDEIKEIEQEIEIEKEVCLSEEEKDEIEQWLVHYRNWEERRIEIDPVTAHRHQDASRNLAMILIGLPLYLYHWRIIKRETKNKEEEQSIEQ